MDGIDELAPLVGVRVACRTLGVARSTYYRSQQPPAPPRLSPPRRPHPRALSSDEPAAVRAQLNSERFVDRAPRAISATLRDEGLQLCHGSTMRQLEYVGSDRLRVSWSLGYGLHAPLPDHASLTRIQHHKPLV